MRTTVDLDPDVLQAARSLARSRGKSLGRVLSDLARGGLAPRREASRKGFPVFRVTSDAPLLTPETVARALDEEPLSFLLDVNVLVALAWPNHVHHDAAHRFFAGRERARRGWATCPLTQSGFVRVSSHPKLVPQARSPQEAIQLLERIVALPGHEFWSDDVSIVTSSHVARRKLVGHAQVTDAHLLALALARRGTLVTFDRGVAEIVPASTSAAKALHVIQP